MNERVVIIGGGFGGLYAANALKNADVEITLIDRRNHHLFQPLLYQVATGTLSPADIATPLRRLLRHQRNAHVLLGDVTGFDVARKQVILRDGAVGYDTLIVAAGSGKQYFGKDEWAQYAPGLKSLEDATEIRRRVMTAFEAAERTPDLEKARAWLTFVVIGAGPTGVELAGALAEIAHETLHDEFRHINPAEARIILVQSRGQILPGYAPELARKAAARLERMGVEMVQGRVSDIQERSLTLDSGDDSQTIAARTILWTAGVQASPLGAALAEATGAELDRGGRVIVEPDLSLPGYPEIFVIGDMAHFAQPDGESLPGVAQVALQQGRYVAKLIQRRLRGKTLPAFRYRDLGNLATIGRGAAVAEIGRLKLSGWLAWNIWLYIHLSYLRNQENRVLVLIQWLWNFVTSSRSALLITEREHEPPVLQTQPGLKLITNSGTFPRVR
jgi:NADH dehydrogenase